MPSTFDITVTHLVFGGEALGRLPDGRAVFVPFCLPGERVRVRLLEERRGHARAALVAVLEPSPLRVQPRCVHFGVCGGCHYQHMPYSLQLETKEAVVREQLERIGGIAHPPVHPARPSPQDFHYRNAIQFHLTPDGRPGYQLAASHTVFAIQECHLPEPLINEIWPRLDLEAVPGLERVELRQGAGEEILLTLESTSDETPEFSVEDLPLSAVYLGPGGSVILAGEDYLIMEVLGRPFRVSAGLFFQVNTPQAGVMVRHLMERLPLNPSQIVVELYCGVGLFSAFLAPRVARYVGVELSEAACVDFAANLDEFNNVTLYQGAAEEILPHLDLRPEVVLVDPPRAGLDRRVLDALVEKRPATIAYVSCDLSTLARDARRLLGAGYTLREVTPFDLFPQTYHVETISLFEREP
ncbi:MAG TPA: class I SAM-dependent RNA methyltransferase [Anaerolineaceae bacterium]|nr:class I SAM-dependent RNA methyltransferase [Anaerolineaceae bacterium]